MSLEQNFVAYEYKFVTVPNELDGLWADSMKPFGWTVDKKESAVVKGLWGPLCVLIAPLAIFGGKMKEVVIDHASRTHEQMTFKREKEVCNKGELNRLQSQFENSAKSIERLENSKTTSAAIAAYVIGLIGTVFMGISVFSYLAGMTPVFILASVLGLLGWIIPFFAYKTIKTRKTQKVNPQIEAQQEMISIICIKAAEIY